MKSRFHTQAAIAPLIIIIMMLGIFSCSGDKKDQKANDIKLNSDDSTNEKSQKSISELEAYLAKNPSDADAHLRLAKRLAYSSMGNSENMELAKAAKNHFQRAIELNPENPQAYRELGILINGGSKEHNLQGVELFKKAISLDSTDFNSCIAMGNCYKGLGKYEQAEDAFQSAIKILVDIQSKRKLSEDENFALRQAREYLGRIYSEQGELDLAEEVLLRSVKGLDEFNQNSDKYWGCPFHALGAVYFKMGQRNKSAELYIKAAETEPKSVSSQAAAAFKCYYAGDYASGIKYIDRAIALSRQAPFLVFKGFLFLLQRNYDQAEVFFQDAMKIRDQEIGARVGLGHVYLIRKNYADAESLLTLGVKPFEKYDPPPNMNPNIYDSYWRMIENLACLGMGWLMSNQNEHEKALAYFDRILQSDSRDILALLGKANCYTGLKQLEKAEKLYKNILEIHPSNQYALAELAVIKYNQGDNDGAEKAFKKALASDDQHYTCPYEGLGLVYLRQGEFDKAKKNFKKAIEMNPNIEYKKFNGLAKIYIKEGKLEKAKQLLTKSIENYPYDGEAKKLLKQLNEKKDSTDYQAPSDQPS